MIRAVVDMNVVVSGILSPTGKPAAVLEAAGVKFRLVWTPAIVAECLRVLTYQRLARVLAGREEYARGIVAGLAGAADLVGAEMLPSVRVVDADHSDDVFFATALAGGARFIASGDKHVLAVGSYAGIAVLTPAAFLRQLG